MRKSSLFFVLHCGLIKFCFPFCVFYFCPMRISYSSNYSYEFNTCSINLSRIDSFYEIWEMCALILLLCHKLPTDLLVTFLYCQVYNICILFCHSNFQRLLAKLKIAPYFIQCFHLKINIFFELFWLVVWNQIYHVTHMVQGIILVSL